VADDLEEFVLDFAHETGALVERPAFGLIDVLWSDDIARRLDVTPLQTLTFHEDVAAAHPDAVWVTIGHPLVERIEQEVRQRGQTVRWYVNAVRLDKRGLFDIIKREVGLSNAWLAPEPGAVERRQVHYYVRFNFRVALITDEKQEELVSVLMDLNSGRPAWEVEREQMPLEQEPHFHDLIEAPLTWAPQWAPLSAEAIAGLHERAGRAAAEKLAPILDAIQRRTARRLELDRARLEAYYDDTEADLQRRLERTEDEDRRRNLEEKLAFARADRAAKLADVEAKYRLRLALDLINVSLIAQPKLALDVRVENRYTCAVRSFVWDPLLKRLEPGVCDTCKRAFYRLHLCTNGHLMCDADVLTCSMCKREFCTLCQADVGACEVCGRPVCVKSQIRCRTCGRVTCQDDVGQCHADK
jgi:hypothetical protein